MNWGRFLLIAAFSLGSVALLSAEDSAVPKLGEMGADRPGAVNSTDTIPPGVIQLEGGVMVSRHALASGASHELGTPFSLVRIGITRFAELRWSADGYISHSEFVAGEEQHHAGLSDFEPAIKVRLMDERKHAPAIAVIGALSLPVGSDYFSSGGADPSVELDWSKSLPGDFSAGGGVNAQWQTGAATSHTASLSIGKKLRHGFATYGEVYWTSPIDGDEGVHWIADTGITRQLGARALIDVEAGHTMSARTPYWFVSAGFAVRVGFPTMNRRPQKTAALR